MSDRKDNSDPVREAAHEMYGALKEVRESAAWEQLPDRTMLIVLRVLSKVENQTKDPQHAR